jgi:hypothetical protein
MTRRAFSKRPRPSSLVLEREGLARTENGTLAITVGRSRSCKFREAVIASATDVIEVKLLSAMPEADTTNEPSFPGPQGSDAFVHDTQE